MADSSLQERLREHAQAFDGLLSLIPAKYYYEEDNSDQWKKKKQTKAEAAAARRAKLDPDSVKSAKDVMDERARKRKLEEMRESGAIPEDQETVEMPKEGMKIPKQKTNKKPKIEAAATSIDSAHSERDTSKVEQRRTKAQLKKEKKERDAGKKSSKKARKSEKAPETQHTDAATSRSRTSDVPGDEIDAADKGVSPDDHDVPVVEATSDDVVSFDATGLAEEASPISNAGIVSPKGSPSPSPIFDIDDQTAITVPVSVSTTTSTSSVIPPSKVPKVKIPVVAPEALKERLAARIEALRAARKADGPDGLPARNRQELMEARRKKEEQRRAAKKALRAKARQEEEEARERALERASASARESPSIMSLAESANENFSFGRVKWADGSEVAATKDRLAEGKKARGPRAGDALGALKQLQKKTERIGIMDESKREVVEDKELWSTAKKRATGEKVRDDSSLLKKALKRKETIKKKSEKEWATRKDGIERSQARRQKKREENIQKRKDEKGKKGKKASSGKKVKSRPGFEGSFGKRK